MSLSGTSANVIQFSGNSVVASPPAKTVRMLGQRHGQLQVVEAGAQPQVLQIGNQMHVVRPEQRLVKVDAAGNKSIILQTTPVASSPNLQV